jgi:hypothetical protein
MLLAAPVPAHAAGAGADGGSLAVVVLLVGLVGTAYLLTHFVVDWIQRAFLVATNVEYLILGALLGLILLPDPATSAWLGSLRTGTWLGQLPWPEPMTGMPWLPPLVALACGWIGLLYGMALDLPTLLGRRDGSMRAALADGLLTAVPVGLACWGLFQAFAPGSGAVATLCASVLGTTAWAGSTSSLDVVRRRYGVEGDTLVGLTRSARFADSMAILAFGSLFAIFHGQVADVVSGTAPLPTRVPTPVEWVALTLGLGAGLGLLFSWFLDDDDSEPGALVALVGIIAFASGAAYFLDLSELTVNLVVGVMLVNTAPAGARLRATLASSYRPINLLLLLLAGAIWDPPPWNLALVLVPCALGVRFLGKVAASRAASWGSTLRSDNYRGALGQGDVAIAMAITFKLVFDAGRVAPDPAAGLVDATYTAILVGVVLYEIVAPRALKSLLVDAGEIRRESAPGG